MSSVILAKDAEVGKAYISRGGREVVVKAISNNHVKVKVVCTGNTVPVNLDYPLIENIDVEFQETVKAADEATESPKEEQKKVQLDSTPRVKPEVEESEQESEEEESEPEESPKEAPVKKSTSSISNEMGGVKGIIYSLLETGEHYSVDELAEKANAAKTTVRLKLSELRREDGIVIDRENKKYFIREE